MSDDRLRWLAFRWGLVALVWQLYHGLDWPATAASEWQDLLTFEGTLTLEQRMGHLKPDWLKWPADGVYVWSFLLAAAALIAWMWYAGVRRALRNDDAA